MISFSKDKMMIKPEFWDYKNPNLLSKILFPFTLPVRVSNFFFKYFPKINNKKIISICVGNIYLGGTGKTPTTIKLYNLIRKLEKKIATGKKFHSSHQDEIKILKKKTFLISKKSRNEILKYAVKKGKKIIIFDDGLQDKYIDYDIKFVCFDSLSGFGNGNLIPAGPLREDLLSIKRFDAVFIKKIKKKNQKIINDIKKINPRIKIFNTQFKIKNKKNLNLSKKYLVFSGIGNSDGFYKFLKNENFKISKFLKYPDHYKYRNDDLKKIIDIAKKQSASIITTEKDFTKIPEKYKKKIKYIEVDLIIENELSLIKFIKSKIYEKH
jgi:tetraacyldisaccharide 4'-kinase